MVLIIFFNFKYDVAREIIKQLGLDLTVEDRQEFLSVGEISEDAADTVQFFIYLKRHFSN